MAGNYSLPPSRHIGDMPRWISRTFEGSRRLTPLSVGSGRSFGVDGGSLERRSA